MATNFNLRGKMMLTLHGARNLANRIVTMGKMDPFAVVKLSNSKDQKFKTCVIKDAHQTPNWEQSYIFTLEGTEQMLHCNVLHEGSITDDHIGRCDMQLDMLDLSGKKRWYQLVDRDNFQKHTGEICMSIVFDGHGLPERSQAYDTHRMRVAGGAASTPAVPSAPSAPAAVQAPAPSQQPTHYPSQLQQQQSPPQYYSSPPPQYVSYQAPPVYQTTPPVYQQPAAVYQQQVPTAVVYQAAPQVVYQQVRPAEVYTPIIGYWSNGQPRYLGQ